MMERLRGAGKSRDYAIPLASCNCARKRVGPLARAVQGANTMAPMRWRVTLKQMNQPLKIALVGTGGWARQHARILAARSDVELRGIVGRNAERTLARAREFRTRPYSSIEAMLDTETPDLVCVCLPNQHHFEATLQLIQAGVPLLVEKPLVFELEQARQLIETARERELFFAINFNHRYARPLQMAKSAIEAGELGDLIFASWRFGGEGRQDHPYANLIETQCHGFDQLEWLCGPILSVAAQMSDRAGHGFSTLALALEFESGAVGTLLGSYDSSYAYRETHRLEINGTLGRVIVNDTTREFEFQRAGDESARVWQAGYFNDSARSFERTFDAHMDEVLANLRARQEPPIHASAGWRALQLAHAAITSQRSGRRVRVEP